jgi:hypothetical protein
LHTGKPDGLSAAPVGLVALCSMSLSLAPPMGDVSFMYYPKCDTNSTSTMACPLRMGLCWTAWLTSKMTHALETNAGGCRVSAHKKDRHNKYICDSVPPAHGAVLDCLADFQEDSRFGDECRGVQMFAQRQIASHIKHILITPLPICLGAFLQPSACKLCTSSIVQCCLTRVDNPHASSVRTPLHILYFAPKCTCLFSSRISSLQ